MTRQTPLWLQTGSYAASLDRRLVGAIWPTAAVSGCAVTVSAGTMNMNIAAGTVVAPAANNTGSVLCYSDAVEVVTSPTAPGAGSNRYDVVVCQPRGNDLDGGSNNDFVFSVVSGTASASPTVPATPAGAVALAQVLVIGASASLSAANLIDRRPFAWTPDNEPWQGVGGMNAGTIATTETFIGNVLVPYLSYPHRLRWVVTENFGVFATAATVDCHVRYNTTGAAALVTDTLARQYRMTFTGQFSCTLMGNIDRLTGGTTQISVFALCSAGSIGVTNDPTLAQLEVSAVAI